MFNDDERPTVASDSPGAITKAPPKVRAVLRKKKRNDDDVERPVQYTRRSSAFCPVGKTYGTLEAGSYLLVSKEDRLGSYCGFEPIDITTDDLIRFEHQAFTEVLDDLNWFWHNGAGYDKFGFAHKRGYLLYGPPGSGKTSLVNLAIRDVIDLGGIVFIAPNINLIEMLIPQFRFVEETRPVLVTLEDVDGMLEGRAREERNLLSVLDGETQIDHIAFVATTNYPENMEERLLNRPGRFDAVVKVDLPSAELRRDYFMKKLGSTTGPNNIDLVEATHSLSLGHLRELIVRIFIKHEEPDQVISKLQNMKKTPNSKTLNKSAVGFGSGGSNNIVQVPTGRIP